ncbi:MAG TPA: CHAD domain-containing protein [Candidatus Acidoferrales bacterium]|jgi:CHAD domain-containing protein|nr:CHAD domain-containing protein [Candidatus Acidoferrales bacterium]
MAVTISLPPAIPKKRAGLDAWMQRVLEKADKVEPDWDVDEVHDLRVALRRCRTMAEALSEVNGSSGWRKLKKGSRELFHALGSLRDTQVQRDWVKKLASAGDPVRKHMLRLLAGAEKKQTDATAKALDAFDRKEWKKLAHKLPAKANFYPSGSVVFQRLALGKLNEAVDLYQQARKRRSAVAWHRLRIGLKEFRYIVENFLPERYEAWAGELKAMQDQLGDVHDLDVLRARLRKEAPKVDAAALAKWFEKIALERKARLDEFLAKASGPESPWLVWRAGFQWGHALVAASFPQRRTA